MDIHHALKTRGIAPVDAETLMAFVVQKDRAYVLAHPERVLGTSEEKHWMQCMERRRAGEPVSYITGQREFFGRSFLVDPRVHIPRPSTENLVTMALDFLKSPKDDTRALETGIIGVAKVLRDCSHVQTVVDVGTGSGCIAITMALERPDLHVIAIDISDDALVVARENAMRLGAARIEFLEGDLLSPMKNYEKQFLIVSNPPYIPSNALLSKEVQDFEPSISLWGGADGDGFLQSISESARSMSHCCGYILECLTQQQPLVPKVSVP